MPSALLLCGASTIIKELIRTTRSDEVTLRKRIGKVRAILKYRVEDITLARRFAQTQSSAWCSARGIDQVERRGVVGVIIGEAFDPTC